MQTERDGGGNAEVWSSTTTKSPEEVGVLVCIRDEVVTSRSYNVDLKNVIDTKTEVRRKDVMTTAERPSTTSTNAALWPDSSCNRQVLGIHEFIELSPLNTGADGYS